jgi:hypothetical protein
MPITSTRSRYEGRWRQKERETGTIEAKTGYQKGQPKITDLEAFKQFVLENSNLTQDEMAVKWNVSQPAICRTMKKIGFTVKKNNTVTKSVMKKNEKYLKMK